MPYVSDAQRRLFHAKANRGEISKATVHHWDEATKGKKLPEHVKKAFLSPALLRLLSTAGTGAVVGGTTGALTSDKGHGFEGALRGGLMGGAMGGVGGAISRQVAQGRSQAVGNRFAGSTPEVTMGNLKRVTEARLDAPGGPARQTGIRGGVQKYNTLGDILGETAGGVRTYGGGAAGGAAGGLAGGLLGKKKEKEACVKLASALGSLPEKTRVKLAAVLFVHAKRAALLPSKPAVRKGTSMQKIQAKTAAYMLKQANPAVAALPAVAAAVPTAGSWLLGTALPWLGSTVGAGAAMAAGSMGLEKLLRKKEPEPQPQVGTGMPGSGMPQH